MKIKKRFLGIVLILVTIFNSLPTMYEASGIELTLVEEIETYIAEEMEYGSTKYQFQDDVLNGVENEDEVYLVADVTYDPANANAGKTVKVAFSNFRLEGADVEKYSFSGISEPVEKEIMITEKVIKIIPDKTHIYYGQKKPETISEIADYSSQLAANDEVNITAKFVIEEGDAIGEYEISIADGKPSCDNSNYKVELDDTVRFEVREYTTDVEVENNNSEYNGVTTAALNAPEGFLISKDNLSGSEWVSSIEIDLQETQNGEATYYLRCNDSDSEFYQAISTAKIHKYSSYQTLPEIVSIELTKSKENTTLNFLDFGVFGNGNVKATVVAVGTAIEQETTIYFGEDTAYKSQIAEAGLRDDGRYYYIAEFELTIDESMQSMDLSAYAENSSGRGSSYTKLTGTSDIDNSKKEVEGKAFVLEDNHPNVNTPQFTSDKTGVTCEITITDSESGIAKVEYAWDIENYMEYPFENTGMLNQLEISPVLLFSDSISVEGNKHTFYIKVTDNAGNVYTGSFQDPVGSDMNAPNIKGVEIRKKEPSVIDTVLRFLTFGIFSNDSVEIAITADDVSADNTHSSGIASVALNDRPMELNSNGEYVLTVSADTNLSSISIAVTDKAGWSTTRTLSEINETDDIESNNVFIEDDAPIVTWEFSSEGHKDEYGNAWYGADDVSETFTIKASDNEGDVHSGLYSIKITDNGVDLHEKVDFTSLTTESSVEFKMADFSEGKHTIVVTVEDNAGNSIINQERTFYIDRTGPESEPIKIENTNGREINGVQWFDAGDIIEFRIDASDESSGLKSILVNINNQEFTFEGTNILSDSNGYYVKIDTKNINLDENHKYTISGVVTDVAGNQSELEPLVVYKDLSNPVIEKFTIEKKSNLLDKVLHVLTFGIYTNDSFVLKVYTSDDANDSGIDYAELNYEGLSEAIKMKNKGNGIFSYEIPDSSRMLYKDLTVTVYDKYGKGSITCPNIVDAETNKTSGDNSVLVEQILPSVTLNLPASDSLSQTGNQKWYSTNKAISFTVQDTDSGIQNISFKVNGVDITMDKNGVLLPKAETTQLAGSSDLEMHTYVFDTDYLTAQAGEAGDGKYAIELNVTDNAGNVSVCTAEYFVDQTNPQIDKVEFTPATADGVNNTTEFIQELEYGFYFKTDFLVTVYVSDELPSAGLDKVNYRIVSFEGGVKQAEITGFQKISDGKAELMIPQGFKGQIYIEAFDNVNNSSGEKTTKAYVVDGDAPTIHITKNVSTSYYDAAGNALYIEDNSFTVEVTDEVSGIREIGYSQSAEQNTYARKSIVINNTAYQIGDVLEDGWIVTAVENNLVTKVVKTFAFSSDDNDVLLTFDATDNTMNKVENRKSEMFTIDKTNPIINVSFLEDDDTDLYYDENRVAHITVIDRNLTPELINTTIENTFGAVPTFSFSQESKTEYFAVVEFTEGDYTFSVNGADLGGHTAIVNYSGGNERLFFVDKTIPQIEENFSTFISLSTEDSFNLDKTVDIKIIEHNFDPALVNLQVFQKEAGAEHNNEGFVDVTSEMLRNVVWSSEGDVHTASFTISSDGVYQVVMTPVDLAGNTANQRQTIVFEIDKTIPTIVSRNGRTVSAGDTGYLDVYTYLRQDEEAPTVEFDDVNIDHINYTLTVYGYEDTEIPGTAVIRPVRAYLEEDTDKTGTVMGNKFVLPGFVEDGVYALELVAVDKAGNESEVNVNTYIRLINQDVLACVMNSDPEQKTGLYSFQYENGTAISKRPDNFEDIEIFVIAENDSGVAIVLRDNNGNTYNTNANATSDDSVYGMRMYHFTLESEFFKENFQDDTDIELHLTVMNDGNRIDLGKMHIDNIAPTCDLPEGFESWKWYYGEDSRTVTVSNISEVIDVSQCGVFDNGSPVAFEYSEEENAMTFTLEKGWHSIGIVLSDMAGNTYNIQEKTNIHVGFFWLRVTAGGFVFFAGAAVYAAVRMKKRKQMQDL